MYVSTQFCLFLKIKISKPIFNKVNSCIQKCRVLALYNCCSVILYFCNKTQGSTHSYIFAPKKTLSKRPNTLFNSISNYNLNIHLTAVLLMLFYLIYLDIADTFTMLKSSQNWLIVLNHDIIR